MGDNEWQEEPIRIPIDGVLDLHNFSPRDVATLVPDYLEECRHQGILEIRIIHGKGTGILRERVHSILRRTPGVIGFRTAHDSSGWGATLVTLDGTYIKSPGQ